MPRFDIVFDSDTNSFDIKKDGRMIDGLDAVSLFCGRDFDDSIYYHLSYSSIENGEMVHRSNDFVKEADSKTSPLNASAEEEGDGERRVSQDVVSEGRRVVKNFLAAESVFGIKYPKKRKSKETKKDKEKDKK